jgi:hypothetical protein
MSRKRQVILFFSFSLFVLMSSEVHAQGGWRQWEIKLLDGTSVEGNPLQMREDGRFTRSMDPKEGGYSRSSIDYLAASTNRLPTAPTGSFKQDLIVMLDGKRSFGKVTFKSLKFSEGTIVQNGTEIKLQDVAFIKFAHTKTSSVRKKP